MNLSLYFWVDGLMVDCRTSATGLLWRIPLWYWACLTTKRVKRVTTRTSGVRDATRLGRKGRRGKEEHGEQTGKKRAGVKGGILVGYTIGKEDGKGWHGMALDQNQYIVGDGGSTWRTANPAGDLEEEGEGGVLVYWRVCLGGVFGFGLLYHSVYCLIINTFFLSLSLFLIFCIQTGASLRWTFSYLMDVVLEIKSTIRQARTSRLFCLSKPSCVCLPRTTPPWCYQVYILFVNPLSFANPT